MPRPRPYASAAARQAAYRRRQTEAVGSGAPGGTPPRPAPTPPGWSRWKALIRQADRLLQAARNEMEAYLAQRSESWQETERGETLRERLEAIEEAQTVLEELLG